MPSAPPRLVVSAVGGDGGKTLVSLGLIAVLRQRGLAVVAFKKGPDYIDAAWLTRAAGRPARNLDVYLCSEAGVLEGVRRGAGGADLAIIEGNRGLHDGVDAEGSYSTAALARFLRAPVVLVLNATKVTRTLAAVALGCKVLDPAVHLSAVVLNNVATSRQEQVIRAAIEAEAGIPVIGAVARLHGGGPLPGRHLGLVTPEEHDRAADAVVAARDAVARGVDIDRVLDLARRAGDLDLPPAPSPVETVPDVTVGVMRDSAFSFYYPENLEALEAEGARLRDVSSLEPAPLPEDLDALYVGGGFPETHAARLAGNGQLLASLRERVEDGLPVYAECGGLMLLSRTLVWKDSRYPMAGILPVDVEVKDRPQGHGYCELRVDRVNPFLERNTVLRGHEFHYSEVVGPGDRALTAYSVERGVGCFDNRDGLVYKNVLASYAHLHALGAPGWSRGLVDQARRHRRERSTLPSRTPISPRIITQ
jgi:cobyrinic acid a,c-diamide synthase